MSLDFRTIQFGKTDGNEEASIYPVLLTKGYFDIMEVAEKALCSEIFLFLGYKGSGKSALSEHLNLRAKPAGSEIVHPQFLNRFPYKLFNKVVKGQAETEAKYPLAWEWVFLVYCMYAFDEDCSAMCNLNHEWQATIEELKKAQLFPVSNITDIVKIAHKNTFTVGVPPILGYKYERTAEKGFDTGLCIKLLKDLIKEIRTDNRHYLVIDGLDDFISSREVQQKTIIALINTAKDINKWFRDNIVPFKVIVLCRTDIFDRLSDPNKNKIKRDSSFTFTWFDESEADDYASSNLIALANLRARLKYPEIEDVFKTFFPKDFDGTNIYQALLDYTRHTPRDFLQLLNEIQNSCSSENVSPRNITSGIKRYSSEYFLGEIRDELAGYVSADNIELTIDLLSRLRKTTFNFIDIQQLADRDNKYHNLDLEEVFRVLFECSAIGHIRGDEDKNYFKYRNPHMTFNKFDRIKLHKGLWKVLVT